MLNHVVHFQGVQEAVVLTLEFWGPTCENLGWCPPLHAHNGAVRQPGQLTLGGTFESSFIVGHVISHQNLAQYGALSLLSPSPSAQQVVPVHVSEPNGQATNMA